MSITANLTLKVSVVEVGNTVVAGGVAPSVPHNFDASQDIANGTTSGYADLVFSATRTVNAGANDDLDIVGALQTAMGGNLTPVRIVGIYIKNNNQITGNKLHVGNGANPFFAGYMSAGAGIRVIGPGGSDCWTSAIDPGTPTAGTADILRVNNPGGTNISYTIEILARSA
jgi:hypothetical protein